MLEKDITVLAYKDKNKCNIQAVQKFSFKRSKRRWFKIRQLSRYLSRIHFAPFRSLLVADRSCFAKPVSVNADSFMAALCHPGNAFG